MHNLHLQLFYRIIKKHLEIYLLKVGTLSLAMACGMIIALFAIREFGYDRFYENADNVVRILQRNESEKYSGNRFSNRIPPDVLASLQNQFSNELVFSRIKILELTNISHDGKLFANQRIHIADTSIGSVFSLSVQSGSLQDFKKHERSALLSTTAAQRYFGTADAIGKTFQVHTWQDSIGYIVAGVFQNFPDNAHHAMDVFLHFDEQVFRTLHFDPDNVCVYGRITNGTSRRDLQEVFKKTGVTQNNMFTYHLQPLPDIHFGPRVEGEQAKHGDLYSVMILLCIAGLICFLSVTNFINLTTLTLPQRARELAMKKVFGASGLNLLLMLLREYFIMTAIALLLALLLLVLTNGWSVSLLAIDFENLLFSFDPKLFMVMMTIFIITGIAPGFIALRFTSASATRLLSADAISFPAFKRNISVFQLGISLALLVAGFMINRQIQYSLIKEPGKNHDQVIYMKFPASLTEEQLYIVKRQWKNSNPHILDVIAVSHLPDNINSKLLGNDFYSLATDYDFLEFFKFNMVQGRWFQVNDFDSSIVNEKGRSDGLKPDASPIGTIRNFSGTYHQPDKPIQIVMAKKHDYNFLCIRILEVNMRHTLAGIEKSFASGSAPVKISFLNRNYRQVVQYENRLGELTNLLTLVSALMACCSIYGLSLSISRDKLKQIAVHKMFGATMFDVARIFFRMFVRQLGISILIFAPATYILLNEWLRIFVYAADFSLRDSFIAIGFCVVIIVLTCTAQAIRLNRENLVGVLKGE